MIAHLLLGALVQPATVEEVTQDYFRHMSNGDVEKIAFAKNVSWQSPLFDEPKLGRQTVVGFLNPIVGNLALEMSEPNLNASGSCTEVEVSFGPNEPIEEVHCLTISEGQIEAVRLYFDPRLFLSE